MESNNLLTGTGNTRKNSEEKQGFIS